MVVTFKVFFFNENLRCCADGVMTLLVPAKSVTCGHNIVYYMPSTFYIVKLPLALGNIFSLTESILAQSFDDAKNT